MRILLAALLIITTCSHVRSQRLLFVDSSQHEVSFRGMSVVNDEVLWLSGSKGTIGRSIDGGRSFKWIHPAGHEKRDFRDIEAFDANTAIAMAVDNPAVIIKTTDGGLTWKEVYRKEMPGMFLDAICFRDEKRGIGLGDPINGRFWLIETNDGGDTWQELPAPMRPTSAEGEACFASSGTNIQFVDDPRFEYGFVTGGTISRLLLMGKDKYHPSATMELAIDHDLESTGANSWAVNGKRYVVIGGDFKNWKSYAYTTAYSNDAGATWSSPTEPPQGYKSCVIWKDAENLIATGLSGVDISKKGAKKWDHLTDIPFHVVQKAKKGNAIFLAGGNGYIGRYVE